MKITIKSSGPYIHRDHINQTLAILKGTGAEVTRITHRDPNLWEQFLAIQIVTEIHYKETEHVELQTEKENTKSTKE